MRSTNIGVAVTNAPAKPLRREGIRCMKLSRGLRSNPGIETISAAGLSVAVAQAGVSVQLALAGGRDSCRVYRWYTLLNFHARVFFLSVPNFAGLDGGGVQGSRDVCVR